MTTAAAASIPARGAGPLSRWLSVRHPLHTEAAVVLFLYGLYEVARGLVVGNAAEAERHARQLAATERSLHLLVEAKLQSAVHVLPGLMSLLAAAYVTLHVAVTAAVLLWLHQRRPAAFPFVRTTLLLASGLSLIGFLAYPTSPRGWPGSASPTPSRTGRSISTTASSARSTTRTPPSPACTSAMRWSSP
jgi:PAP2 superfamily